MPSIFKLYPRRPLASLHTFIRSEEAPPAGSSRGKRRRKHATALEQICLRLSRQRYRPEPVS